MHPKKFDRKNSHVWEEGIYDPNQIRSIRKHYKSTGEIVLSNLGFSLEVDPPEDKFFQGSCQSSSPIGKQSH